MEALQSIRLGIDCVAASAEIWAILHHIIIVVSFIAGFRHFEDGVSIAFGNFQCWVRYGEYGSSTKKEHWVLVCKNQVSG